MSDPRLNMAARENPSYAQLVVETLVARGFRRDVVMDMLVVDAVALLALDVELGSV